ncbi:hypothetical protein CAPTEDRAFT_188454, partial [Capitella teleta]
FHDYETFNNSPHLNHNDNFILDKDPVNYNHAIHDLSDFNDTDFYYAINFIVITINGCLMEVAFTVTRQDKENTLLAGPNEMVYLSDLDGTNAQDRFDLGTDTLYVPTTGMYFTSLCAGFVAKETALLRTRTVVAASYELGLLRQSTAHESRDAQCRSGIQFFEKGARVNTRNDGESTLSDDQFQTMWSSFSVTDSMLTDTTFAATITRNYNNLGVMTFNDVYVNENAVYDEENQQYICGETGVYLFDLTVGLRAGQAVRVAIERTMTDPKQFELTRTSTSHDGLDTLGRTIVVNCQRNERVFVNLIYGELYGSEEDAVTSFSGFQYKPCSEISVAWAAYRNTEWQPVSPFDRFDPVTFNLVEVNLGVSSVFYESRWHCFVAEHN